jgi:outer membrane immunogenic protein
LPEDYCFGRVLPISISAILGAAVKRLAIALLAVTGISVGLSQIASAADLPVKAAPVPVAAPVYSWTGCYIGANTGGAWARKSGTITNDNTELVSVPLGSLTTSGWAFGGQIGCDYQFNNNWVVGIRGMADASTMKGSNQIPPPFGPETNNVKIASFVTAVGKLGYLLTPTLQFYGLAGVAWVRDQYAWTDPVNGEFASGNQTRTGYDVGIGFSWMFTRNWDLWVEYDHMGFGTKNVNLLGEGGYAGNPYAADVTQSVDKVLVGIDYRFNLGMVQ